LRIKDVFADRCRGIRMQDRIYLLSIKDFVEADEGEAMRGRENSRRLLEEALCKVDPWRREKAARMKAGRPRAASLGAGLLLQLAVKEAVGCGAGTYALPEAAGGEAMRQPGARDGERAMQRPEARDGEGAMRQPGARDGERAMQRPEARDGEGAMRQPGARDGERAMQRPESGEKQERAVYTVSRLLGLLSQPLPLMYQYGINGKPYLKEYPFYFNLSHSGDYVLCAVSSQEIGVDIQQHRAGGMERLAQRFFSAEEVRAMENRGEGKEAFFYRLWARKEAYGKLTGEGIAGTVGISLLPGAEAMPEGVKLVWKEDEEIEGYSIAVVKKDENRYCSSVTSN